MTGNKIAVLLTPTLNSSNSIADFKPYGLAISDHTQSFGLLAMVTPGIDPQVLTVNFPADAARVLRVTVIALTANPASTYQLDIDLDRAGT